MDVRKIKILQITAIATTVKHLLLPLIERLKNEGHKVQTVCSDGQYVTELREEGYSITTININRKIAIFSNLKSLFSIYTFIKKKRFDIVHVHTPVASLLGRIAAKLAGVPVVIYTAHGFYFHENMAGWKRHIVVWLEKIIGRLFTDMLLTQSAEDKQTAIKKKIITKNRIEWIGNGVDINRFVAAEGDNNLKNSLGMSNRDRVIGFTGRIVREKGIEELILAFIRVKQAIPDVKLMIIGDTLKSDRDRRIKQNIKQLIDINKLGDKIIFTGFREEINRFYNIMDVFVLPSWREGMPRSILEAMASAKPVVATNIRGCREEVIDGVTGRLVPVKNEKILAKAIKEILLNKESADRMGGAGRRSVEEKFDENMVLERQLRIYRQLINEKIYSKTNKRDI